MSSFQAEIIYCAKKQESTTPGKKHATETARESQQMLDLIDKDFKKVILSMFEELKETVIKEVKECMTMSYQTGDFNEELDFFF